MPPIQLLIKPVSENCNLNCSYCFYEDVSHNRLKKSKGFMTNDTLERLVKLALEQASGFCVFAFQGGEPTLIGLDFYRKLIDLQKEYQKPGIHIENIIQTNGYNLDEEWALFLSKHGFLVGISLDGIKRTHDAYRVNYNDEGSFLKVMNTIRLFEKHHVNFNVLTVVHKNVATEVKKIYNFYKKNNFDYQQYIACLEPLSCERGATEYSLTPELYGEFLIQLFELWYEDLLQGKQPYIRQFENYVTILLGKSPESCECKELCGIQKVVEADGSVYPCDFYALDEYYLGNILDNSFEEMLCCENAIRFQKESKVVDNDCLSCEYYALCKGGCARQREGITIHGGGKNYFCESYRIFFKKELAKLYLIVKQIKNKSFIESTCFTGEEL